MFRRHPADLALIGFLPERQAAGDPQRIDRHSRSRACIAVVGLLFMQEGTDRPGCDLAEDAGLFEGLLGRRLRIAHASHRPAFGHNPPARAARRHQQNFDASRVRDAIGQGADLVPDRFGHLVEEAWC